MNVVENIQDTRAEMMALGVAAHLVKGAAANLAAERASQHAARSEKLALNPATSDEMSQMARES